MQSNDTTREYNAALCECTIAYANATTKLTRNSMFHPFGSVKKRRLQKGDNSEVRKTGEEEVVETKNEKTT